MEWEIEKTNLGTIGSNAVAKIVSFGEKRAEYEVEGLN